MASKSPFAAPWLKAGLAAVLILGGAGFYWLYRDEPAPAEEIAASPAVATPPAAAGPKNVLHPQGRVPRPPTLDPAKFQDPEVRAAYEVARKNPELLEKMPCYCGCFGQGHKSNYDCFVDNHGLT
jgi:hypothetical protein